MATGHIGTHPYRHPSIIPKHRAGFNWMKPDSGPGLSERLRLPSPLLWVEYDGYGDCPDPITGAGGVVLGGA
jgi:hypothetical protein